MNPRHAAAAALLMMTASIVVETQTATSSARLPAFEVATVKWHKSDAPRNFWLDPGGRLTITGFTLRDLIRIAYGSDESKLQTAAQFIGGPSWVATDRFDIAAKAEGDVYPNQAEGSRRLLGMLNRLITDAFVWWFIPRCARCRSTCSCLLAKMETRPGAPSLDRRLC